MKTSRIISWHLCLQFLSLPFLFFAVFSSASKLNKIPKLSPTGHHETFLHDPETPTADSLSEDYETFFYNQTLDHFNYRPESYSTFRQRYVVNSKYWGGSNAPIFAYLGAEAPLDGDLSVIGFLTDNALEFKALQIYIEHRYYGKSIPYGSREEALNNASTLGYFNSAQAIADYAEILLHVKQKFHAEKSPVIVIGGSYGGMLASWFRLKYPHIALGALASSAPILYFDNITSQDGYYSIVTKDFIKSSELKDHLESTYATAAQYNHPPRYPVNVICGAIDGANNDDGILGKIFAGLASYRTNRTCYVNQPRNLSETDVGWNWQTCSEMVIPIGISNNTMFPASPFELQDFINECKAAYDVPPRPHWVTTYYGGKDIKLILRRFASNIIFSNGLRDPYSSGGVLENISKSVVAVTTTKGSHCLDILQAKETDPDWLVKQRKVEVNIIKRWIAQYYFDLEVLRKIPS
ncbi:Lysosomal Pro-X carboxypeptidase [Morus notabilis]|uniref:Lysosomal Pro-X carboxypeptidase n=1 Tax=Morus notabilis TaxID=981085 RepID=W9RK49_9ROSA|nr:Lysosomal Pro-X carboxypeptidase [Morus notabilis]